MQEILVNNWEEPIKAKGTCLDSVFVKSFNDEIRNYLDGGVFATKIVFTEIYKEKWDFNGTVINIKKTLADGKTYYGVDMDGLNPDNLGPWNDIIAVLRSAD